MTTLNKIKKLIRSRETKTDPQTRDKILAGALAHLDAMAQTAPPVPPQRMYPAMLGRRIAPLAAAAAVIIAAIWIFAYFAGKPVELCSLAAAKVAENLNQVVDFTYRYRLLTPSGTPDQAKQTETVLCISPDLGVQLSTYVDGRAETRTFLLPAEKVKITMMPEQKRYQRHELTDQTLQQVQQEKDPRQLIRQFLSSDYRDLGCALISGIRSRGIEVSNPRFLHHSLTHTVGRLWVNVKTQLPVRLELEGTDPATSQRVRIVADEFRWEADLQKEDFGPFIPEDYTLQEQENPAEQPPASAP